jgi:peptide/nickel transport system substrate-binding protein
MAVNEVQRRIGMHRRLASVAALVALATALAAWSAGGASGASTPTTFTYASQNSIVTDFDPATSYSNEVIAMNNVYEQLTRYDIATKTVKPLLATKWASSAGGKTWTFTLRKGVKFHTGRPVTAQAAKAAIERTITLKGGPAYIWDAVKTIATPTPLTLVFHLKFPAPLDIISSSAYAAYIYDTKASGTQNLVKWFGAAHDAGSGPYTVGTWKKGQQDELQLNAFKGYWGGWSGAHYTSALFEFVPQPTTQSQLLQSGEVTFSSRLTPQLFAADKSNSALATEQRSSFQNLLAMLNTASGPLQDVRVRQAVADSIDYAGLVSALKGSAVPASGYIPQGLIGYSPSLGIKQDITKAKALLAQAGYGSGKKKLSLTLTLANGDADEALTASVMKSDLAAIGVNVTVQTLEWQTQWAKGKSADKAKRQDIFLFYWYPDYADPYSWFINLFHSASAPYFNLSYLASKPVDSSIDTLQAKTATSHAQANAAYVALQKTLLGQAVALPLYVQNYQRVYQKSMTGYVDNPSYSNVVFVYDLHPA